MKFFVSCAKGLEYLLVDELAALGAAATATVAGVNAQGEQAQALRAVMWSRLASRVLWPLTDFDCPDEAALYAGVAALAWPEHLGADQTLAVDAHVSGTGVTHARFAAQRVKDAVVDRFRAQALERPSVDVAAPDLRLNLVLRKGRAWLSVDLGGGPLHRRGWRIAQGEAPLKEHLAAAVLLRAQWPERYRNGGWLLDPMCGSGTLLIEGALMAADVAPGLLRHGGSFPSRWRGFDVDTWQALREEAQQRELAGRAALRPLFFGSDADPHAIEAARLNAMQAGVHQAIHWEVRDIDQLAPPAMPASSGETPVADAETQAVPGPVPAAATVVCNPPYDARLAADPMLYRRLGTALQRVAPEGRASLLCGSQALAFATGLRAARSYQVFNGALECVLIVCDPIRPAARAESGERVLSEGAAMVANRLRKNLRKLKRWREQASVSCFRAYDADLPEYAAAIDVYREDADAGAAARTFLHVQEYAAPASVPEADARRRLRELLAAAREVFDVPPEQVALKARRRGKGGAKYADVGAGGAPQGGVITVREHGARLQVNLFDYLDTGLFLDHRPLRGRMAQDARGRRFLNLFAYTGVASVQAAVAGAAATTSVDLSATYLQWCAENLRLNGLGGHAHQLVQADVLRWLEAERGRYDLIFCDPPTFSNSARAEDFDVQRDHVRLLRAAVGRLAQGGVLYFSNNFRRFRLDEDAVAAFAQCEDISASTLPPDFERNPRIHRCWRITQGAAAPMRDSANSMST